MLIILGSFLHDQSKYFLRYGFFICFLFIYNPLFSQIALKGKVIDAEDNKPLEGVSVFLSSTSIGLNTNKDGFFIFKTFPSGKFQLVVSYIGYQTYTKVINSKDLPLELKIELKSNLAKLPDVVLEPWEPNGWEKWGILFTEMFIGTSNYAKDCQLLNPEAIKFRFNKPKNILTAVAFVPLVIVNKALGYEIQYKLEDFEYDFSHKIVTYNGFPYFKDLAKANTIKAKRWEEKRRNVYYGSVMHFMRSVFMHNAREEGYEIRSLGLVPNLRKERAKVLLVSENNKIQSKIDSSYVFVGRKINLNTRTTDSTDYYKYFLKQPDLIVSQELINIDSSICFKVDSSTCGMFSTDSLEITYLRKNVPVEYKQSGIKHRFDTKPVSQFSFVNRKPVFINGNGYYYGPYDLKINGFWAWWETLSTLLPYDYLPPN